MDNEPVVVSMVPGISNQSLMLIVAIFFALLIIFMLLQTPERRREIPHGHLFVGDTKFSVLDHDHHQWLICDGRSLHRHDYHELFKVIGTTFGSNDSSTFKLPDARGRVVGSVGQGQGLSRRTIADMVGEEKHTMTIPELVSHTHTGTTQASGIHNHTGSSGNAGGHNHTAGNAGNHNHTLTDPGHNHVQVNYNDDYNNSNNSGQSPTGFTRDAFAQPANYHETANINNNSTGISIAGVGDHTHSISTVSDHNHSISNDGSHTHTFTTDATGQTRPFNVMQPTIFAGNLFIFVGETPHHPHPTGTPSPSSHPRPSHSPHP